MERCHGSPGTPQNAAAGELGARLQASNWRNRRSNWAVAAWVRHRYTEYDDYLANGMERQEARELVREKAREVLARWKESSSDAARMEDE